MNSPVVVVPTKVEEKTPAVDPVTGELNYTSVSALNKFNPDEYGGCETRWWLKYRMGMKEEQTGQQKVGLEGHAQVEHYLPTGEDVLGPIAAAGKYLLPQPGPDLLVEWGMNDKPRPPDVNGKQVNFYPLEEALLRADGLPMLGFMDWINPRGWYVTPEGVWAQDPPGTIEVGDNKFIGNIKYAKTAEELAQATQMLGYGEFLKLRQQVRQLPELHFVRLSHNSFQTRNSRTARKTTVLIPVETISEGWEKRGHVVVRRMREVGRITREEDVPANLDACNAYNKQCDFRNHCSKYKTQKPIDLLKKLQFPTSTGVQNMASLVDKVRSVGTSTQAAASGTPATPWIPPPPPVIPQAAKQLTAKDAVSGQAYEFSSGAVGMFLSAIPHGTGLAYSFLQVGADGTAGGTPFPVGAEEPVKHLPVAAPAAPPAPPAPPLMRQKPQIEDVPTTSVERAPDAPQAPAPLSVQTQATAPAAAPATIVGGNGAAVTTSKRGKKVASVAEDKTGLRLFLSCVPSSPYESLDGYIAGVLGALQEMHKMEDIRFPPDANHALAFDRWTGALAAAVRASPPPAGDYVVFRGSKIVDVVSEVLIPLCAPGNVIRGI